MNGPQRLNPASTQLFPMNLIRSGIAHTSPVRGPNATYLGAVNGALKARGTYSWHLLVDGTR